MKKKYKLRNDLKLTHQGRTLYRIEALRSFGYIRKGDLGGYIEKEKNLSHYGNSWIYGDAQVYGNAQVYGDAQVCGNAQVYGNAQVCVHAQVWEDAQIYGNCWVYGNARVYGKTFVYGNAEIYGDAEIYENAQVDGNAEICGNAVITKGQDYYVCKNIWSNCRHLTYTRSNRMWKIGCFYGTGEALIEKAYKDSEVSGREYKRVVEYVEAMYNDLEKDK